MRLLCIGFCAVFSLGQLTGATISGNLEKARYITITEKTDGFGAQLHRRMSAVAFAAFHGKEYVHLPFSSLQHNYHDDPELPNTLERFASVGLGFPTREELGDVEVYEREDYRYYTDQEIDAYYNEEVLSLLKRNYYSTPKATPFYYAKERIDVAVHIRRGDVVNTGRMGRWMCDEHYLAVMQRIRKEHPGAHFHIHSEGEPEMFTKFQGQDVELHLNEEVTEAFHALVSADILVTSKSMFSYVAALLSEGAIYYTPCWGPKLAHWSEVELIGW